MSNIPVLGFNDGTVRDVEVVWANGTPVGGLLGADIKAALAHRAQCEQEARERETHEQQLRDQGVTILADHKRRKDYDKPL